MKVSAYSRWLCAGVDLRALAVGSVWAGNRRRRACPRTVIVTQSFTLRLTAAVSALGLLVLTTPAAAQAPPPLGTVAPFAVLGGSTVTNTGPTVLTGTAALPGNLGVSPGSAITGFFAVDGGPGILTGPGASIHQNDAVAIQAQIDLVTAYNNLAGRPTTVNLTGQDLGGLTLVPGVYNFSSAAQLTGTVTLNGLGNPNSVFIFNIGSTLTTATSSVVALINGAQGGNVFWRVGSSSTIGTSTSFAGDILALTDITLNTTASITCGAAWARNGAVTLDSNMISLCDLIVGPNVTPVGPTGVPLFTGLLPPTASANQFAVAAGLDAYVAGGGALTLAFLDLFNLSPAALANALTQLSGEAGTGIAQVGSQAMDSFLSLVTNPFTNDNRPFDRPPLVVKARGYAPERPQGAHAAFGFLAGGPFAPYSRRWSTWAAAYGTQGNADGDVSIGSHDRSGRSFGVAAGFDYRITPYTIVGFALGGGKTNYGLSEGLGGGRSDMFQTAAYSLTWINAAYVSTALAFAWHRVSTERTLTIAANDQLTADFSAMNIGGRIEGGYRFAIPGPVGWTGFGFTPYGAVQVQTFRTPSYSEEAASGSTDFALAYEARTINAIRTEVGAWVDRAIALHPDVILALRTRAAWAHDHRSDASIVAAFQALPGSSFTVNGASPAKNSLLASAAAEGAFRNGITLTVKLDTQLSQNSQTYVGTARLRYTW